MVAFSRSLNRDWTIVKVGFGGYWVDLGDLGGEAILRAIVFLGVLLMTLLAGCGEGNVFELAE